MWTLPVVTVRKRNLCHGLSGRCILTVLRLELEAGTKPWSGKTKEEPVKAFEVEARLRRAVEGIPLVANVGLKAPCIRIGRGLHARWIKRGSNEQDQAIFNDDATRVLECGIEQFAIEGVAYHALVAPAPGDTRALIRITTLPTAPKKASTDTGYVRLLFGEPFLGLTSHGVSGTNDHPGSDWEEALYVLRPVDEHTLDALLVHTQNTATPEDFVVVYNGVEPVLLSYDEFLSDYVLHWLDAASSEQFQTAYAQAHLNSHRELSAFLAQHYSLFY